MIYMCKRFSYEEMSFGSVTVDEEINDWFQTLVGSGWEIFNFIPTNSGGTREIFIIMKKNDQPVLAASAPYRNGAAAAINRDKNIKPKLPPEKE